MGGLTPELQRAAGVLAIVTPGRTKAGLAMLEEAERLDPGLPFLGRALGQAHLLAAKHAFADGTPELALERIERRGDEPGAQIVDPCEISRREQGSFRTQGLRARRRSPEDDYQWRKGPLDPSAAARACGGDGVDDPNSP